MNLQTSNKSHYDVIIVGAGINGCTCAYYLHQAGLKVALIDKTGIASGGSGAAGAFISPKFNKQGPLKELLDTAYEEAMTFYTTVLQECTLVMPLEHTTLELPPQTYHLEQSAIVNARMACQKLSEGVNFHQIDVQTPRYDDGWHIGGLIGTHLILAIGAYPKILPIDYVGIRGVWGHRIDVSSTTTISKIYHQYVSVSPTLEKGIIAIGATHNVHYSPFDDNSYYDIEEGRLELLEKAKKTFLLDNIKMLHDYTGLRSGSNDYMPMLGSLVNAQATLNKHPHLKYGKATDPQNYIYYPSLTMLNGSGGYGFVLAPYLAKRLKEYMVDKKELYKELSPSRFFPRWARRHS